MAEVSERENFSLPAYQGQRVRKFLLRVLWRLMAPLPDRLYLAIKYRLIIGRWPDLDRPRTFTEKVQARKLRDRDPFYGVVVDKAAAKDFIRQRVGEEHVIPTVWVGTDLSQADWTNMPYPVVVKPTHASGLGRFLYSKTDADAFLMENPAPAWLAVNHARFNREWAYSRVKPQIIIERMLLFGGAVPWDYRIFTFGGRVSHICLDIRKGGAAYAATYSADWRKLPFYDPDYLPLYPGDVERPANLETMVEVAEKLAAGFDFVRVDLYSDGNQVYVGELTLYPGGGFERFDPPEYDRIVGDKWPTGRI
jgi:hypothetical protein